MDSAAAASVERGAPEQVLHVRVQPSRGWLGPNLRELREYHELLYFLTWRDVKVRYKQTALGVTWAIIQPFMTMVAFSLFFGQLARVPSDGLPYPIFAFAGLLPWTYFSQALALSSNSLVGSANLITKIYFPRMMIPISSVLSGVIDFLVAFVVLILMMVYFGVVPGPAVLAFPVFLVLALVTALGVGLWLSALNVEFRDVRYVVPFLTQFWLFLTPVAYPSSLLQEPWHTFYGLNPMVGVVEGFRWALLGSTLPLWTTVLSGVVALLLLVSGGYYFRRMERTFADVI